MKYWCIMKQCISFISVVVQFSKLHTYKCSHFLCWRHKRKTKKNFSGENDHECCVFMLCVSSLHIYLSPNSSIIHMTGERDWIFYSILFDHQRPQKCQISSSWEMYCLSFVLPLSTFFLSLFTTFPVAFAGWIFSNQYPYTTVFKIATLTASVLFYADGWQLNSYICTQQKFTIFKIQSYFWISSSYLSRSVLYPFLSWCVLWEKILHIFFFFLCF